MDEYLDYSNRWIFTKRCCPKDRKLSECCQGLGDSVEIYLLFQAREVLLQFFLKKKMAMLNTSDQKYAIFVRSEATLRSWLSEMGDSPSNPNLLVLDLDYMDCCLVAGQDPRHKGRLIFKASLRFASFVGSSFLRVITPVTCIGDQLGIGHGIKYLIEAHKGPFTGQGQKAYMRSMGNIDRSKAMLKFCCITFPSMAVFLPSKDDGRIARQKRLSSASTNTLSGVNSMYARFWKCNFTFGNGLR
ncbi:photosystem I P700 chlorophyll a apoprotein A1 [Striga asiatica]|uniref:Photosystem I P700 chlorophyll a apoprotein A1 n=1 Tax=Striga asiatica TaxID=4170 RepID=A0A5A7P274_STRAF|nr:photosystem I P700 chlorophyll a apoprotein A1 [Striga asiatica]